MMTRGVWCLRLLVLGLGVAWPSALAYLQPADWAPSAPFERPDRILTSPLSQDGLAPCNLAVVLDSRQTLSPTNKSMPEWAAQRGVCHFHLVIPFADVLLHEVEKEAIMTLLNTRPRTTVLLYNNIIGYTHERSIGMQYTEPIRYVIVADRELRVEDQMAKKLFEAITNPPADLPGYPLQIAPRVWETSRLSEILSDQWRQLEFKEHLFIRQADLSISPRPEYGYMLREDTQNRFAKLPQYGDLIEEAVAEPHISIFDRTGLCERCRVCPTGHFEFDPLARSAKEEWSVAMSIIYACGTHHIYHLSTAEALFYRNRDPDSIATDVIKTYLDFLESNRDTVSNRMIQYQFGFDSGYSNCNPRQMQNANAAAELYVHVTDVPRWQRRALALVMLNFAGINRYYVENAPSVYDERAGPFAHTGVPALEAIMSMVDEHQLHVVAAANLTDFPIDRKPYDPSFLTKPFGLPPLTHAKPAMSERGPPSTSTRDCVANMKPKMLMRLVGPRALAEDKNLRAAAALILPLSGLLNQYDDAVQEGYVDMWFLCAPRKSWFERRAGDSDHSWAEYAAIIEEHIHKQNLPSPRIYSMNPETMHDALEKGQSEGLAHLDLSHGAFHFSFFVHQSPAELRSSLANSQQ
ncbi:uncharacterized protein MONBRDRAFT_29805 [Monosiga brevicollis MX1]|uniref:Uncharacterized protein n=1 Tax=Monosiga brevicollis TaxID=81824 RepID=A9VC63_MONBE|nr:uncharacterized protein MONBRDRAFT_29805 [Monosiga brevicollis MX1]EDQ84844.1 predicted protein [Monosiga brevicollis MX1]|eukprot:XP_001750345.1 hypothetical protein [Monosiga brevicollis MX1]